MFDSNKKEEVMETKKKFERYKNVRVEHAPTEKFTEMVQITKAPAKLKSLIGKRFISLTKAKIAIDTTQAEKLIEKGGENTRKELMSIGLESVI